MFQFLSSFFCMRYCVNAFLGLHHPSVQAIKLWLQMQNVTAPAVVGSSGFTFGQQEEIVTRHPCLYTVNLANKAWEIPWENKKTKQKNSQVPCQEEEACIRVKKAHFPLVWWQKRTWKLELHLSFSRRGLI